MSPNAFNVNYYKGCRGKVSLTGAKHPGKAVGVSNLDHSLVMWTSESLPTYATPCNNFSHFPSYTGLGEWVYKNRLKFCPMISRMWLQIRKPDIIADRQTLVRL